MALTDRKGQTGSLGAKRKQDYTLVGKARYDEVLLWQHNIKKNSRDMEYIGCQIEY